MGLYGSLLAHRLALYGVPFTWHDSDAKVVAWKASTGAIYPAGAENHGPDKMCYDIWKSWFEAGHFADTHLERSTGFVFCTKNPPHKGAYEHWAWAGNLRMGAPSYHLNSQAFVEASRNRFNDCWVDAPTAYSKELNAKKGALGQKYIRAHSFTERLDRYYWGWTRLVKLDVNPDASRRPAFYFRPDRFRMAYAYPMAGTDWYYAGSNIIQQKLGKERDLDPVPKYERWKSIFEEYGQGHVKVGEEGQFLTGWRPAAAKDDTTVIRVRKGVITMRPLWNSGIRHFPQQWIGLALQLGLVP